MGRTLMSRVSGLCVSAALIASSPGLADTPVKISRPGVYEGYSPALYDGYARTSQYVRVRDGTRIAVDIFRPTIRGALVDKPLPVVWMNTPYNRRIGDHGPTVEDYPGGALGLVKYGYIVVIADMRGNFASFGKAVHDNRTEWSPPAYWDAYDITEWLARQPWSDSKIGMWGCSATGHSQWQAAATVPPHLKAIYPMSAPSEYYDWGGIAATQPAPPKPYPSPLLKRDDNAVAVDDDKDGKLLAAAKEEHRYGIDYGWLPYRDSTAPEVAERLGIKDFKPGLQVNTFQHFATYNKTRMPIYETSNFGEDMRVKLGVIVKLHNITGPLKLIMAPGNHCNWSSDQKVNPNNAFNATVEEHRWFDYWLKGVQNGILNEPPITLWTYNAPAGKEWLSAWQWPLPTAHDVNFYFGGPGEGTKSGVNNGSLARAEPEAAGGKDDYVTDYTVVAENRETRGLTYTTAPLAEDATLAGHPVIHLWIRSTASDGDFLANLSDVAPDGTSTALPGTDDGRLRASHRTLGTAPYDNGGLPYHRSYAQDVKPLMPGAPAELVFDLAPVSWIVKKGHRIRLTIAAASVERHSGRSLTPILSPPPLVSVLRDAAHPSRITLPINAPLDVSASVSSGATGVTARIVFPESLNSRYLSDLPASAISLNGVDAAKVHVIGHAIEAEFKPGAVRPGEAARLQGGFGFRYFYGDLMHFSVTATVIAK